MATAFAPDLSTPIPPLARAAPKLALAASAGTAALGQALAPAPSPFAAAEAEFWRLSAIEETIDGDTDAAGAEAAAKNTNAALRALLDIPAASFADAAVKVEAIRAVYDVQAVPCLAEALAELATFTRHDPDAALAAELVAKGVEGPLDAEFLSGMRQDREFAHLTRTLDTMPDGAARYRRALVRTGVITGDDPTDAKLVAAWEAWRSASKAIEDSGPDAPEEVDAPHWRARDESEDEIIRSVPAGPAGAEVALRLALGMSSDGWAYSALLAGDDTTLFARADELDDNQRVLIGALSVLARPTINPNMLLPGKAASVDQMTGWLDVLAGDGPRYAKLWLRLMDAAKVEVRVEVRTEGDRLWCGSINFSPEGVAADQALRAHLAASGHRQAVVDRVKARYPSPSATDLLAERQQAFAAAEDEAADDSTHDRWLSELSRLEDRIFSTPAVTKDDLLAKSLLAVRLLAEGSTIVDEQAEAILAQAQELGLPVTDKVLREAHA